MTETTTGHTRMVVWEDDGDTFIGTEANLPVTVAQVWEPRYAALLASAPDLLAALEAVAWSGNVLGAVCPSCRYHRDEDGGHAKDCDLANALDKARGIGQNIDTRV